MDDMVVPEEEPEEEEDEPIELDELERTPFTYFYLSSRESTQALNAEEDDDDVILMERHHLPSTHPRTWRKKLAAGKQEIDNLTLPKAITAYHLRRKQLLRRRLSLRGGLHRAASKGCVHHQT